MAATPALTLLDRFPDSPDGHIQFLEFVRDEVHAAADAKRRQSELEYANATIESMVGGIHWAQASRRLARIDNLPPWVIAQAAEVLNWTLTPGSVVQVDQLLVPAVEGLRSAYEAASAEDGISVANRGMLATVFADSMKLADDAAPALTAGFDGESLGGLGMHLAPTIGTLLERLNRVPSISGIPTGTLGHLKGIARIIKGTRTECIGYGDVALFVARSELRTLALDGWKSLNRSKPQNKELLAWADEVDLVPETISTPKQQPERGTIGWLLFQLSSAEWYTEHAAAQRAKMTGSPERRGHDSHFLQTAMQHGRDAERIRQSIAAVEGVGRLQTLCDAQGMEWGSAWLRQQRGRLCESLDVSRGKVDSLTVVDFGEQLRGVSREVANVRPKVGAVAYEAAADDAVANTAFGPNPEYPNPPTYARDKWLYENIGCNSFPSLQLKLKEVAKRERFEVITSRPGMKKAADRYAAYHQLPLRRFSGNAAGK